MKLSRAQRLMLVVIGGPIAVLMLGLLILAVAVWRSGDLEPVKAQARADGLQTDWSDPMWAADADHAVAVTELEALAAGIVLHAGSYGFSRSYTDQLANRTVLLGQPGSEIPAELLTHYGAEPPPWLAAFSVWRQRHAARPFRLAHPADKLPWEAVKALRNITNWLSYRVLVSEQASLSDVLALLDTIDCLPTESNWQAMQKWKALVQTATLIRLRQDAWGDHIDVLIEALRTRRQRMAAEYQLGLRGQFIAVCEVFGRDPHDAARDLGIAIPSLFEIHTIAVAVHRLGRVSVLDRQRQLTVDLLASPNFMSSLLRTPTGCSCGSRQVHAWHPDGLLDAVFNFERNLWLTWMTYHKTGLELDLALADLTGKAWPPDPLDPAGAPLRLWSESGVTVGVISVGPDQVSGTADDWRIRLRDPLRQPGALPAVGLPPPTGAPTAHPAP